MEKESNSSLYGPIEKQEDPQTDPSNPNLITNMSHNFYKTRLCPHIIMNKPCFKGSSCTFAHSYQELCTKPNLSKTKLCTIYSKAGHCPKGNKCNFAHGAHELYATSDYYKTVMCREFPIGGCKFGSKCRFAHSKEELRPRMVFSENTIRPHKCHDIPPHEMYKFTSMKSAGEQPKVTVVDQSNNGNFFNVYDTEYDKKKVKPLTSWQDIYRPIGYPKESADTYISSEYGINYEYQSKNFASTLSLGNGSNQKQ